MHFLYPLSSLTHQEGEKKHLAGEKEKPQINCPTKGTRSIPGQGTKIWQAVHPKKKDENFRLKDVFKAVVK